MGRERRHYFPAIDGAFAPGQQILWSSRELFLMAVHGYAPGPLYALRDEVYPKFTTTFAALTRQGRSTSEVCAISLQAVLESAFGCRSDVSKKSYKMRPASASLVNWSTECNLTGYTAKVHRDAVPEKLDDAILDTIWPTMVGLETIIQWHFSPAGWLWLRRNPPSWRPPVLLLHQPPLSSEIIAPIQLKSAVAWRPETPEQWAEVKALRDNALARFSSNLELAEVGERVAAATQLTADFQSEISRYPASSMINAPLWTLEAETEAQFRQRMQVGFDDWLEGYIADRKKYAQSIGLVEISGIPRIEHFRWAAKYQVGGESVSAIVDELKNDNHQEPRYYSKSGVENGIKRVLDAIKLAPRRGRRGPRAKR